MVSQIGSTSSHVSDAVPSTLGPTVRLSPVRGFMTASALGLALAAFGLLDVVTAEPAFQWSFFVPGALIVAWALVVFARAQRRERTFIAERALRPQHYVQACAQAGFLVYWGWYWRPVYESAFLIIAQLVFAYAFEMLLTWTRRDVYRVGFGPFPVIFSINLFLWFGDEYYYLQFLLIALGFAAKELIRWHRDGRRVHIFNPSSFPLAVFSVVLILTSSSDMTWGQDIAVSQFYPPHVYLVLFLVAVPGQYLFGVTSMTVSAVLTTYLFGLFYFAVTGTYFFYDSYIPIAVFLGMHLLFTDPSTAPRSELGRILFGVLYGLSTLFLYAVLSRAGVPTFYDKLLQVPLLNLSVRALDRTTRWGWLRRLDPAVLGRSWQPRQRRLAWVGVWTVVFSTLTSVQAVGDRHPGQWVPFWQEACRDGRPGACVYLVGMHLRYCRSGSGWACNEAGVLYANGLRLNDDAPPLGPRDAEGPLRDGCALGFQPACDNLTQLDVGVEAIVQAPPTLQDYPIILRGTKGPVTDRSPAALYERACAQGWVDACAGSGPGHGAGTRP